MLHVLNGDATRLPLEQAGVPGEFSVWADALHAGPVPAGLSADELRRVRVAYFAARHALPATDALAMLESWDAALDSFARHDEVVFWFEHDLFDQLILIRHLQWLSTVARAGTRFSLICIDNFPGVHRFTGLGMLTPAQLASLLPLRHEITEAEIDAGRTVWDMYRSPDPLPLQALMVEGIPALPFLAGALRRHFEDYPWTRDGLSRTERQMLEALAGGLETFSAVFKASQHREERVYMGDTTFRAILGDLASARHPLVLMEGSDATRTEDLRIRITDAGREVLGGQADHVRLNGIDRWMGGVHLDEGSPHRWNGESLVG